MTRPYMQRTTALRERLVQRLHEIGVEATPDSFRPAKGHYRTSPLADTYRWEAAGLYNGIPVWLSSFDRMTDCANFGVEIETMRGGSRARISLEIAARAQDGQATDT